MENDKYVAACKVIDGMTAICGDGKKEVKKLVASILGVEVKEERTYQPGDVFKITDDCEPDTFGMLVWNNETNMVAMISKNGNCRYGWYGVANKGKITQKEVDMTTSFAHTYIGRASEVLKVIEK